MVLGSFLVDLGKLEVFEITPWINALHQESSHVGALQELGRKYRASKGWGGLVVFLGLVVQGWKPR